MKCEILCGIGDCISEAIKNIELIDNEAERDVEIPCCLSHALTWDIMGVFKQYSVNASFEEVHKFVKREVLR